MSHQRERKEKICLNCGIALQGRFCHVCGQENLEPKESVWHLVSHFLNDITHFDGKFFTTLKDLVLKPGFLSREYLIGRRASYLNPVRMYVFTSAIFFLVFFSVRKEEGDALVLGATTMNGKTFEQISKMDSATFAAFTVNINKGDDKPAVPMTRSEFKQYFDSVVSTASGLTVKYKSKDEYDSVLKKGIVQDGWLMREFTYKKIYLNKKYNNNINEIIAALKESVLHRLPQLLFVSLPLLALLLQLLYIRRREFFYVSHGIFSIHLYIFVFITMLVQIALEQLNNIGGWGILNIISNLLSFGIFIYAYLAMKKFYKQGWFKTFIKYIILNILFLIVLLLLFTAFSLFSFYKL
ncbi:MAG: DUF3667 domain-containing protein [Bacteroidetes bacterium]|nr:DUF3667 domain-containing protein [Bacteroidota bacterium]